MYKLNVYNFFIMSAEGLDLPNGIWQADLGSCANVLVKKQKWIFHPVQGIRLGQLGWDSAI